MNKIKHQGLYNKLGQVDYNKQYSKQYREANKEQLNGQSKQKHNCQCGGCYTSSHKAQHYKSAKHLEWGNLQKQ